MNQVELQRLLNESIIGVRGVILVVVIAVSTTFSLTSVGLRWHASLAKKSYVEELAKCVVTKELDELRQWVDYKDVESGVAKLGLTSDKLGEVGKRKSTPMAYLTMSQDTASAIFVRSSSKAGDPLAFMRCWAEVNSAEGS